MLKSKFITSQMSCILYEWLIKHIALIDPVLYLYKGHRNTDNLFLNQWWVATSLFIEVSQMVNSLKLEKNLILEIIVHYLHD